MNCKNCGAQIIEGSTVCPQCGSPIETNTNVETPATPEVAPVAPATETPVAPVTPDAAPVAPVPEATPAPATPEVAPVVPATPEVAPATPVAPTASVAPAPAPTKKGNNVILIVIIAVLVVAILVVCYFLFAGNIGSSSKSSSNETTTTTTTTAVVADTSEYYTYENYKFKIDDIYSFTDSKSSKYFDISSKNYGINYLSSGVAFDTMDEVLSEDADFISAMTEAGYSNVSSGYGDYNGNKYYFLTSNEVVVTISPLNDYYVLMSYIVSTGSASSITDVCKDLEGVADRFSEGTSSLGADQTSDLKSEITKTDDATTYSGLELKF